MWRWWWWRRGAAPRGTGCADPLGVGARQAGELLQGRTVDVLEARAFGEDVGAAGLVACARQTSGRQRRRPAHEGSGEVGASSRAPTSPPPSSSPRSSAWMRRQTAGSRSLTPPPQTAAATRASHRAPQCSRRRGRRVGGWPRGGIPEQRGARASRAAGWIGRYCFDWALGSRASGGSCTPPSAPAPVVRVRAAPEGTCRPRSAQHIASTPLPTPPRRRPPPPPPALELHEQFVREGLEAVAREAWRTARHSSSSVRPSSAAGAGAPPPAASPFA